jgi:hypothetical protein
MKYLFWIAIFIAASVPAFGRIAANNLGDDYQLALHFTSPLSLLSKFGGKLEARGGNISLLFGATKYYGSFPGNQFSMDVRRYLDIGRGQRGQNYFYAKGLFGHEEYANDGILIGAAESDYYGGGFGVGRHISFGSFFIDLNAGGKYVRITDPWISPIFFLTGPGAMVDIHFNFGFQG